MENEESSSSSIEKDKDNTPDEGRTAAAPEEGRRERETSPVTEIKVTVDSSESDQAGSAGESSSRPIRRGSMKLLHEVTPKENEPIRRKSMQEPVQLDEEKPKRKETLKIFQREARKTNSLKKDKGETKKEEKQSSRFSDGFLSIDSKFRRPRSKSAERRARTLSKRKGSEGGPVPTEIKRKGSDGR